MKKFEGKMEEESFRDRNKRCKIPWNNSALISKLSIGGHTWNKGISDTSTLMKINSDLEKVADQTK